MSRTIPIANSQDLVNLNKRQPEPDFSGAVHSSEGRDMAMVRGMMQYARARPGERTDFDIDLRWFGRGQW